MAFGFMALVSYAVKRLYRGTVYAVLNSSAVTSQSAITASALSYFHLKSDSNNDVMIYDHEGTPIWRIEHPKGYSGLWDVYAVENRLLVARIQLTRSTRFVQFMRNPEVGASHFHRDWHCGMMFNCQFSLKDGSSYVWTKQTQYLEEIMRGSDGQECRLRVARANRIRPWSFDWEVVVSNEINPIIALVTAFIPMYSQWDKYESQATTGISLQPSQYGPSDQQDWNGGASSILPLWDDAWEKHHLVHDPDSTDLSFFNPPRFLNST